MLTYADVCLKCVRWLGSPKSQDLFKGFDWVSPYYSPGISFRLAHVAGSVAALLLLHALLQLCCTTPQVSPVRLP
jgi:hypothetical protein